MQFPSSFHQVSLRVANSTLARNLLVYRLMILKPFTYFIVFLLTVAFMTTACQEAERITSDQTETTEATQAIKEIPGTVETETTPAIDCEISSFSDFVEICTRPDQAEPLLIRLAFSFFPDGTDFDFENKKVVIKNSFEQKLPDGVDVQLTAPQEKNQATLEFIFTAENEAMTVDGLTMPLNKSNEKFKASLGLVITIDGIQDASDSTLLLSELGTLEDYYQLVQERKLLSVK